MSSILKQNNQFSWIVPQQFAGMRIDAFLAIQLPMFSRSVLQKLIQHQQVIVNGNGPAKSSYKLKAHDHLDLLSTPFPAERKHDHDITYLNIKIVAEYADFLIIDKPAGLIVHPPEQTYKEAALTDWLLQKYPQIKNVGDPLRPGIVHRLDRNTSGIMIIALTNTAHQKLSQMFKDRMIKKVYIALVKGHPAQQGIIDFPIGRHPVQKNIMHAFTAMAENTCARDAYTQYKSVSYFTDSTLLQLTPTTGRTHQIRVHCAAIGHALIGDTVYGTASKKIGYHALHATDIFFTYNSINYHFTSPIATALQKIINTEKIINPKDKN